MAIYRTADKLVFFAHVPRCGGTSVESHLERRFGKPAFLDRRFRRRNKSWTRTSPQHMTVEAMRGLFPDGFFDHVLAVVRHPEDRAVSAFLFQRDVERSLAADMPFGQFLAKLAEPKFREQPAFDNHFLPQSSLVPEGATVFRLEDGIAPVLKHIDALAGVDHLPGKLPHKLKGASPRVEVTEADRELLMQIYGEDFQRFGYVRKSAIARPPQRRPMRTGQYRIAIKTSVRSAEKREKWGDWHFACGVRDALEALGHEVRVDIRPEWHRDPGFADVDIVLRGHDRYDSQTGTPNLLWILYPGSRMGTAAKMADELQAATHVAVSSLLMERRIKAMPGMEEKTSAVMQGFHPEIMHPGDAPRDGGYLFVGTNYGRRADKLRPIVRLGLEAGCDMRIIGPSFGKSIAAHMVEGEFIANERLGDEYRRARAILCDHLPAMRELGYISNRIYDALACGTPVICDDIRGLPVEFAGHVFPCRDAAEFRAAVETIETETDEDRAARQDFARTRMPHHAFAERARQIDSIIQSFMTGADAGHSLGSIA